MDLTIYQDIKYRDFQKKLTVSSYPMIGVRIPILRKLAKKIDYDEYLKSFKLIYYEEVLLYGMIIVKERNIKKRIQKIHDYLKYIDCWSICDTFCTNLYFVKEYKDKYFQWILSYLEDDRTFYVRFGLVMLLKYYTDIKYLDIILAKVKEIKNSEYYCYMAIAWLLCELAVNNRDVINNYIKTLPIDIQKMYLKKVNDSYRIKTI